MRDASRRAPEGEAVVERAGQLVLELHGPGGAAVGGFVDAEVGGVVADGLEIGDAIADALDVAELQGFCAGDYARPPVTSAVGGDDEGAAASGGPDDAFVHGLTAMRPCVVLLFCGVSFG